jgi:hypothetical protein
MNLLKLINRGGATECRRIGLRMLRTVFCQCRLIADKLQQVRKEFSASTALGRRLIGERSANISLNTIAELISVQSGTVCNAVANVLPLNNRSQVLEHVKKTGGDGFRICLATCRRFH